jgi:hypothetical protein
MTSLPSDVIIGSGILDNGTTAFQFKGLIDEVAIFNRTLSASEIQALYIAGNIGQCESPVNQTPMANAGGDVVVECEGSSGNQVILDGSGSSDPDNDPLTYSWTGPFPEGSGTVTGVSPTVTLPLGTSTITLVVNDGTVDSAPDDVAITVATRPEGLEPPLGALVSDGESPPLPDKSFKQGRVLPLRVKLFCGATALTDTDVFPPRIAEVRKMGEAIDLVTLDLDPGLSNDNGLDFRSVDTKWSYNLSTKDLSPGSYEVVIEMPDGERFVTGFVLK